MRFEQPAVYAVKHKNEEIRMASRSGGIFTALSDIVLGDGGVVYGCVLEDNRRAVHVRAETPEQRDRMRGSKYIQSEMGSIFSAVKADLAAGKQVLFSGTSCQVDGLRSYLGKDHDGLICVDIVCHGVPSPLVWQKYLQWQEQRNHASCTAVDFRNKKDFGWTAHKESLWMKGEDGALRQLDSSVFTTMFYGHAILRPSCYQCPYKAAMHPGDITIADYWGIEKAAPGFSDDRGVSLVLVNSQKGDHLLQRALEQIDLRNTRLEDSLQPPLIAPFEEPPFRKKFWRDFHKYSFVTIAKRYGGYGKLAAAKRLAGRAKRKALRLVKKAMGLPMV